MKFPSCFSLVLAFLSVCSVSNVSSQNVPIDFEASGNGASWTWTVFENDDNPPLEIIANPYPGGINGSATVAKFTAKPAGNPWAGCESLHGADIGSFTIDSTNMIITIMVWKSVISDVGIKLVRFDNWSLGEIKIPNTLVNQWEQITFDFSSHMGNTYDQIVIFPDFNGRSTENIIYFDNVFGPGFIPTGIEEENLFGFEMYPNPSQAHCSIHADRPIEEIKVFNLVGEMVLQDKTAGMDAMLDLSGLPKGVFVVQAQIEGQMFTQKLVRN